MFLFCMNWKSKLLLRCICVLGDVGVYELELFKFVVFVKNNWDINDCIYKL